MLGQPVCTGCVNSLPAAPRVWKVVDPMDDNGADRAFVIGHEATIIEGSVFDFMCIIQFVLNCRCRITQSLRVSDSA